MFLCLCKCLRVGMCVGVCIGMCVEMCVCVVVVCKFPFKSVLAIERDTDTYSRHDEPLMFAAHTTWLFCCFILSYNFFL